MPRFQLLPEWAPQAGVLLTWPHADTDWQPLLSDAERVYVNLAGAICRFSKLVVAAPSACHSHITDLLVAAGIDSRQWVLYEAGSNDTWARDHGPLTVSDGRNLKLMDFTFNGWGGKFTAELDNQISRKLAAAGLFAVDMDTVDAVLEGGAIEIDETGAILTTSQCLLNPNRNPELNKSSVETLLRQTLGAKQVNWLDHGYLAGDDTDSHVDTLVRLGPQGTLVYIGCDDPADEHFEALAAMEAELTGLTNANGEPYRLYRLPWPKAVYSADGERLPATYANFLILNGAVLVPTYADANDAQALTVIGEAFPGYEIIGIDCRTLIEQHGSLHCVTMQLPVGVVNFE